MLVDLHIRNLAVIEETTVEFGPGLNVVTGETGAGKSIVVDALALLAGARASGELLRRDAETLTVTGRLQPADESWHALLDEAGIEAADDGLVIRREITREGRNRAFVNDRPVTVAFLSRLAAPRIRIHTQREELGLLAPETQRSWLDASGGEAAVERCAAVAAAYGAYRELATRLERQADDATLRRERIDLLRFQLAEIDAARPVAGEDENLRVERDRLRNASEIGAALSAAHEGLFEAEGSAVEQLGRAARELEAIAGWEPEAESWAPALEEIEARLADIAGEIRARLDRVEADPARLDDVESRLAALERLFAKYGAGADALLEFRARAAAELEDLDGDAADREGLAERTREALEAYRVTADALSESRREWAVTLSAAVERHLSDLALDKARFEVGLSRRSAENGALEIDGEAVEFGPEGYDVVEFLLAANPGENSAPLAGAASGGELARVYLALRLAATGEGAALESTLVFDEVDVGIGGAAAAAVGRKLARLAANTQILAVTHLPQVASHGDRHLRVEKRVQGGRTRTGVVALDGAGRIDEIARMLAGDEVTPVARANAEELLDLARRGAA